MAHTGIKPTTLALSAPAKLIPVAAVLRPMTIPSTQNIYRAFETMPNVPAGHGADSMCSYTAQLLFK